MLHIGQVKNTSHRKMSTAALALQQTQTEMIYLRGGPPPLLPDDPRPAHARGGRAAPLPPEAVRDIPTPCPQGGRETPSLLLPIIATTSSSRYENSAGSTQYPQYRTHSHSWVGVAGCDGRAEVPSNRQECSTGRRQGASHGTLGGGGGQPASQSQSH